MRGLKIFFIILLGFISCTVIIGYGYLKSSLPQTNGEKSLKGINNPVTIARDENGVPHISGDTDLDIAFATGFVHAQDRLWQMESNRRIGHGRLAEILGKSALGFDRYFRTLGFSKRAQSAYENLDTESKAIINA